MKLRRQSIFKRAAVLPGCILLMLFVTSKSAPAQAPANISVVVQAPHANGVDAVTFSPNGKQIISSGRDKTLKLWDLGSRRLIRTFEGHTGDAYVIAVSPDGSRILSESEDETFKVWDTATGRALHTLQDQSGVGPAAFSPDGTQFVTQDLITPGGNGLRRWTRKRLRDMISLDDPPSAANILRLWNSTTGELVRTFPVHSYVHAVRFSAGGAQLVSVSQDFGLTREVKFETWNLVTGELVRTVARSGSDDNDCHADEGAFSPDGLFYVARSSSKSRPVEFALCDAATGLTARPFAGDDNDVVRVTFSPDGTRIASAGTDDIVKIWETDSGKLVHRLKGHKAEVHSVAFSPDGTLVVSGSHDKTIKLWDAATGRLIETFGADTETVSSVAFSADGTRMLMGSWDNAVRLWDVANGRLIHTFEGHSDEVTAVAFSPDGSRVVSGSDDTTVKLWDVSSGRLIHTFDDHPHVVRAVTFSPDGSKVLSAGGSWQRDQGTAIELWDARTGRRIVTLTGHTKGVSSVSFSPDGRQALSGSFDGSMKLWDLARGRLLRTFDHANKKDDWGVTCVVFSSDGKRVLSGGEDGDIKLWDAVTGRLLRTFGHGRMVTSIAVSPDSTRMISGSGDSLDLAGEGTAGAGDNKVKLWEIATGKLLQTFEGHAGGVKSVAFSRDGARLLSGSQDTKINLWHAQSGRLMASFTAAGKDDWLAITPEGFFNSTRGGSKLLAIAKDADVITIDQMHQSLFDPDLVRESIAGDLKGEVSKAAKTVDLGKILSSGPAPTVAITSHPLFSETSGDLVTLQARITDRGKGVGRVEWRVNGITAAVSSTMNAAGADRAATQTLALDAGDNTIEVVAYNEPNLLASVPARVMVKFTGPADRAKPKLHVLAIGINAYGEEAAASSDPEVLRFPQLTLAVNDARTLGDDLKQAGASLYDDVTVTYALNADATKEKLEKIVERLAKEIQPRDTFILYAAAHGISENGRFYLIPQDFHGKPSDLVRSAISQDELQDWLANRVKARKAIVLLDTCESGALVAGHSRSRTDGPASDAAVGRLHEATGRPVLTAAASGEPALEGYKKHGVFTWAVLDALRKGDTNGNGTIELSELVAHVQNVVPTISAELSGAGRGTVGISGSVETAPDRYRQAARFGSRGEDFTLMRRLP